MTSGPAEPGADRPAAPRFGFDLPAGVAMSPAGDYLFRAGHLLVPVADLDRPGMRDFLRRQGELRQLDPQQRIEGLLLLELREADPEEPERDPAQRTLAVLEEAERLWPDCGIDLNYVFVGTQAVMGGPATVAEPAEPPFPAWAPPPEVEIGTGFTVGVLDTGIIGAQDPAQAHALLAGRFFVCEPTDDEDLPAATKTADCLAAQAGHGTFVAGIVRRIAPAARIGVRRVLSPAGEGDVVQLALGIARLVDVAVAAGTPLDVVNLSLGGYTRRDRPPVILALALAPLPAAGIVVVAAAGNNASWRPFYPAALPGVVGVGALDGRGPAPFTNFGPWVDACAPGVDVVSTFFDESAGELAQVDLAPHPWSTAPILARFPGFARWSGTSFAAPAVTGAIVAAAWAWKVPVAEAARRLLEDWHRCRVPDLGVVVNAG